ncbi:hypothetical protein C8Q75DRAFT_772558 [Abortiporus biennis]|nr:hypothetical protein C8Q75DRAFT_772558 [Abortiporus biennis]
MAFNNDNDNFNSDPNSFGSTGGARRSNRNDPSGRAYSDSDFGSQGPLSGTQGQQDLSSGQQKGDQWDSSGIQNPPLGRSGGNQQWSSDRDTSDISESGISGTGGNQFGSSGRQGQQGHGAYDSSHLGRSGGATTGTGIGESGNNDEWDNTSGDNFNQSAQKSSAKPPMGERLKGTMEQMTGKVTGNKGMAERGQERKLGDDTYGGSTY